MAEEIPNDSFPELREVENKVGRKTPESLLIWMRDAADCEDGWRSDAANRGDRSSAFSDSFSDKISSLKQEMRWLRSADVKILRQLVAVHEGIEAMRWLMEERGAFASLDSSLTGSLSSLVTVEEHGLSMSSCRERQSPTQDLTENSGDESADHPPHSRGQSSSGPANCLVGAKLEKSQPQGSDVAPLQDIKDNAGTIKRALLRSNRAKRNVNNIFPLTKQSEETQTEHKSRESSRDSQHDTVEEEGSVPNRDTALLDYDAHWCWVESQDDITFL